MNSKSTTTQGADASVLKELKKLTKAVKSLGKRVAVIEEQHELEAYVEESTSADLVRRLGVKPVVLTNSTQSSHIGLATNSTTPSVDTVHSALYETIGTTSVVLSEVQQLIEDHQYGYYADNKKDTLPSFNTSHIFNMLVEWFINSGSAQSIAFKAIYSEDRPQALKHLLHAIDEGLDYENSGYAIDIAYSVYVLFSMEAEGVVSTYYKENASQFSYDEVRSFDGDLETLWFFFFLEDTVYGKAGKDGVRSPAFSTTFLQCFTPVDGEDEDAVVDDDSAEERKNVGIANVGEVYTSVDDYLQMEDLIEHMKTFIFENGLHDLNKVSQEFESNLEWAGYWGVSPINDADVGFRKLRNTIIANPLLGFWLSCIVLAEAVHEDAIHLMVDVAYYCVIGVVPNQDVQLNYHYLRNNTFAKCSVETGSGVDAQTLVNLFKFQEEQSQKRGTQK